MRWCIQDDSRSPNGALLKRACDSLGLDVFYFESQTSKPPDAPRGLPAMFYGSSMLIRNVVRSKAWSPGAYFDEDTFRFSEYLAHYGTRLLNSDARFFTLGELARRDLSKLDSIFIRADRDLKELPGCLWPVRDFSRFVERLQASGDAAAFDLPIAVATPKKIEYEWRLFLVDGRVSSGSQYRHWGDIEFDSEVPSEVVAFAEETAAIWSPARAYVMDIASFDSVLSVIELNGFNSSGFYQADIAKVVSDIDRGSL
jgi:hypothetical protein